MPQQARRINFTRAFWKASLHIAGIVAGVELLVMFLLRRMELTGWLEDIADAAALTILSAPLIYYRAIRPLQADVQIVTGQLTSRNEKLDEAMAELNCLQQAIDQHAIVEVSGPDGRILSANGKFTQISGYSNQELVGDEHDRLNSGVHDKQLFTDMWRSISHGHTWHGEICNRAKDGSLFWVDTTIVPFTNHHNQITKYVAIRTDITGLKRAEQRARESEERYALAERGANDGLWDWNLLTNEVYFSPRAKCLLGYGVDDAIQTPEAWFRRIDERHAMQFQADLALHTAGTTPQLRNEHCILAPGSPPLWLLCRGIAVRNDRGQAVRLAGSLTDITRQKEAEEHLRADAMTDRLTGLANRAMAHERINAALRRHRANPKQSTFAVLFLDFDRFKIINDSLGHEAGDSLLRGIAERLKTTLRGSDVLGGARMPAGLPARMGGDEFVVLLEDPSGPEDAMVVADRLLNAFASPHKIGGHEVVSTVSIGITTSETGYDRAEDVIRDADTAMYRAKTTGKARHVLFNSQMHDEAKAKLKLESDLRAALDAGQFRLHYQPILALDSGDLYGFEALIRWRHPERGLIPPCDFIPLAEETGLILPIGQWVAAEAARQLQRWRADLPHCAELRMNFNLSRRQIIHPDLVGQLRRILQQTGLPPHLLRLEITESMVMHDTRQSVAVLDELRKLGVKLVMDDFGTGYSSLSCLHRFPIDELKIDRSFILNMSERPDYAAVIHAIVTLAHNLRISVTAEGIEQAPQLAQLQALDCDHGQGYHFARPMDAEAAEQYLINRVALAKTG